MHLQTLLQSLPPSLFEISNPKSQIPNPQPPSPSFSAFSIQHSAFPEILHITDDSRKILPHSLFIARIGTKKSGADFAHEAIQNGALAILSEEKISAPPHIPSIQVTSANLALPLLAHALAGHPTQNIKMLAVTGTKGKTTVAYLLRSILKAAGHKVGMIGTVEIDDGQTTTPADMTTPSPTDLVDLFVKMRINQVTHCIMEVSSHALHQHRVAGINFQIAIFTNLTGDHLDYHKNMDDYAAAKALLFKNLTPNATAIINVDDPYAERMIQNCQSKITCYRLAPALGPRSASNSQAPITLGATSLRSSQTRASATADNPPTFTAEIQSMTSVGMQLLFHGPNGISKKFASPLVGRHNVYNTLSAIAATHALGIPLEKILDGLDDMEGVPGRLQPVVAPNGSRGSQTFQIFVDYAHTHDALENVLRALRQTMSASSSEISNLKSQIPSPRLICLFGCGGDRDRTKRPKMAAVAERLADLVILTSDNPRTENPNTIIEEICTGFSLNWQSQNKIILQPDRRLAIQLAISLAQPGDVVLLAGKGHETYQILGTTKHHFDDVEEATIALQQKQSPSSPHPVSSFNH